MSTHHPSTSPRPSNAVPTGTSSQKDTSSDTQRKLYHLNSQMAQLNANLSDFNDLLVNTCSNYEKIEQLGKIHASIFMAGHSVFEEENFN
ncbi:hypothetical protein G210_5326 [Candida maltosa Xu316]|uniref:Uncharacterized protein n=1 Tax=Candida maltosa (strain Xu316) TaxID=1245528 RepID=M3K802_CANMX|nr:hypothetical protein G210_5326 [Candida maltosa Xu316]